METKSQTSYGSLAGGSVVQTADRLKAQLRPLVQEVIEAMTEALGPISLGDPAFQEKVDQRNRVSEALMKLQKAVE